MNHEWQTQALAAVDTANAVLEGDDAATDAATPTVRLGNICQISDKVARVSGTQQAVEHAGRDDEMAYQEMLKGLELKRDMEAILVGTNQAKNDGQRVDRPQDRLGAVLDQDQHVEGRRPAPIRRRPTAPAPAPTARSGPSPRRSSRRVLQSIWNAGGKPDTIMTGGFNKQVFSTFTGRATPIGGHQVQEDHRGGRRLRERLRHAQGRRRTASCAPRDVLVLQIGHVGGRLLHGRKMVSMPLAKTGDSDRRQILSEYALVARNEKASGGVFDLTTS